MAASVILLSGCSSTAEPGVAPTAVATSAAPDERIAPSNELLAARFDPALPGCSAAVAVHGSVIWAAALGTADLASGAPLTTDTRFDIASLTKQFTATAVLMLQRKGALALSDPIGDYVKGLPSTVRSITLDALMHHTSHIPDYWTKLGEWGYGFETPATQADALRAIKAVSRLDAGTGYVYSNSNYILLAEVIATVTGVPYSQYISDTIFTPLGLNMQIDPVLQAPDIAVSYDDSAQPSRNAWDFYGAFGIFTTPTELARWGDQYRDGGAFIGNDFATGAVDSGTPGEATEGRVYAAGMNINADGSLRHDGRMGGFTSTIKISADRETTLVVMCNSHLADRNGLVNALWKIWVDKKPSGD